MKLSPANKEEYATIKECVVKIKHLEESLKDLKQEARNRIKEKVETQRYISNTRLAIYLTSASILGGFIFKIVEFLFDLLS